MSTYSYDTYHYYKEHGICIQCHQEDAAPGRTRCLNCLSIMAENQRRHRNKLTEEEREEIKRKKREQSKALRDYRRENGLCLVCGKPVYKNYSKCYEHYLYFKRIDRERREAKKKGYAELGLCRICGEPTVEGKKFCAYHLEQYREKMRKANAIKKEKRKLMNIINRLALSEALKDYFKDKINDGVDKIDAVDCHAELQKLIRDMPIAYDPVEVVIQLKKKSFGVSEFDATDHYVVDLTDAVDIVQRGGM